MIHEHRGRPGWCPHCRKIYEVTLPIGIERGGLVGPRLTTVIAYFNGVCHASFSTVRKFVRDVLRATISRGQLANIIAKVSQALEQPYEQLLKDLPDQERLNVDETGHKQNRLRQWTWCFRAGLYTLFKIDPTRSADVLIEVLGTELYCTRWLGILARSVSEVLKPFPRLHFGLVWDVSLVTACGITECWAATISRPTGVTRRI